MLLVTCVATSPNLQGEESEFTDASGQFFISNLPPGPYTLVFTYGGVTVRREGVEVYVGKVTQVNAKINTQATGETIVVHEKTPTIDAGSTKQGVTIEKDYMTNIPNRGRTYEGVLGAAAGAQNDDLGVSFSGSTSVENNYVVDGLNTTGLTYGTVGSPVLNNFISEIEVITGGYNAEFGRSTGGVVNVVTKSGSNEFHGSVWANVQPFEANRERISTAGSSISAHASLKDNVDFGFDLGGPIIKDKVWFYVGFAPIIGQTNVDRIVSTATDRQHNDVNYSKITDKNNDGSIDGDNNPATSSGPRCELDQNCESDGVPDLDRTTGFEHFEEVDRTRYVDTGTSYQFTAKVNFAVNPDNQGQVALTGTPSISHDVGYPAGTPTATQTNSTQLTTDLTAKWTSKFNNNKTQVDALFGWHRDKVDSQSINSTLPDSPSVSSLTTPLTEVFGDSSSFNYANLGGLGRNRDVAESDRVLRFCTDQGSDTDPTHLDPFKSIVNCPLSSYAYDSSGSVINREEGRVTGKLTLTQRVKALGHHQFKIGGDVENNTISQNRNLTGGRAFYGYSMYGLWDEFQFVKVRPTGKGLCSNFAAGGGLQPCDYLTTLPVNGGTFNWSGFVQDSWNIMPNLTLNAGLRYEQQKLNYAKAIQDTIDPVTGKAIGSDALHLTDLAAPRIGLIYDWTKEGRSKIYASWGRFYESIPLDINRRSFGGEATYDSYWDWSSQCGAPQTGANDPRLPSAPAGCPNMPSNTNVPAYDSLIGGSADNTYGIPAGVTLVMPGIKAQYMDEIVAGVEYELLEDLRVGASYQNRQLGRVIEDMSVDGAATYILGNPGSFDDGAKSDLMAQIASEQDPTRKMYLQNRLDMYEKIKGFPTPVRNYNAFEITAAKRFSRNFMVQGSYTYSVLSGNYPGLYSPDNGQLDPNITSEFDLIELLANRKGPLPQDRPHMFKLDGYYTFDLGKQGSITTGARLRAQSGQPENALGSHYAYGPNEAFILPRGAMGRTEFSTGADLHVAYARKIGDMEIQVSFELFNIFNQQTSAVVDNTYTGDYVDPIVGGTKADLPYLKTIDPNTVAATSQLAVKNLNFQNTIGRFSPLSGRFGVTLVF